MKWFDISDFDCPCCGLNLMQPRFLELVDDARSKAGVPFIVNSGTRCPKHNADVGGVTTSSHLVGWAADIHAKDSSTRFHIVKGLMEAGFTRIKVYKSFIHACANPEKPEYWLGL